MHMKKKDINKLGADRFYISDHYKGFMIAINSINGLYIVANEPEILTEEEEQIVESVTGVRINTLGKDDVDSVSKAVLTPKKMMIGAFASLILIPLVYYILVGIGIILK